MFTKYNTWHAFRYSRWFGFDHLFIEIIKNHYVVSSEITVELSDIKFKSILKRYEQRFGFILKLSYAR